MGASLLNGCALIRPPKAWCAFDPAYDDRESLLTIDAHAHVFNATDLPINAFITRVGTRQSGSGIGDIAKYLGGLLQRFAWATAPNVAQEQAVLAKLKPSIVACDSERNVSQLRKLREDRYTDGRDELQRAAMQVMQEQKLRPSDLAAAPESLSPSMLGLQQLMQLPPTYEELFGTQQREFSLQQKTFGSVLKFVLEMFQYRFVSIYNYLDTYSQGGELKVDLMLPASVDFDWWLDRGVPTRSTLPAQMMLMKEIAILSAGRVHALVPFDPLRQVVHDLNGRSGFSPIELVRRSVQHYGALAVKLYPPMGFAPYGNAQVAVDNPKMWRYRSWLPAVVKREDFGVRLDRALTKLYEFCAQEEVPVMGHANESNGPTADFERLTAAKHWQRAVSRFKDVSFSFGHFGGVGSQAQAGQSSVEGFLKMMVDDQHMNRDNVAADTSYFSNILDRPQPLHRAMEAIYRFGGTPMGPAVDRLMYGADWKMLLSEAKSESYLADFNRALLQLEQQFGAASQLRAKFFGRNAARFFGLRNGDANRRRLERFYDRHRFRRAPTWMTKLERSLV